jgi:hypothetical protein
MTPWQVAGIGTMQANRLQLAGFPAEIRSIVIDQFRDFALFDMRTAFAGPPACVMMRSAELSN